MREHELALLIFLRFDEDFYLVAYLQLRVVAELGGTDRPLALEADVDRYFALVDRRDCTYYNLLVLHLAEGAFVGCFLLLARASAEDFSLLKLIPVEVLEWLDSVQIFH